MRDIGIKLFRELTSDGECSLSVKKGRNSELLRQRDEMLGYRYWFYVRIKKMRYDIVMKQLSMEFCISKRRVGDIVIEKSSFIKNISERGTTIHEVKKMYPHLNWN